MVAVSRTRGGLRPAILAMTVLACLGPLPAAQSLHAQSPILRLATATTTSTADTGLPAALLPDFEKQCGCRVDVIAVGTGQALEMGRRGDADVLLSHLAGVPIGRKSSAGRQVLMSGVTP